jgi:hypothetical protein
MKILGFAHITFALPLNEYPVPVRSSELYEKMENAPNKLKLMNHGNQLHNLQIFESKLELAYYASLNKLLHEIETEIVLQNYFESYSHIYIKNLSNSALAILNLMAVRSRFITSNELKIFGIGTLKDITLVSSISGIYMNKYLDDFGPVALAFYVDKLEPELHNFVGHLSTNLEVHDPFDFRIGKNKFKIQFISIEGLHIEFLQRQ